MDPELLDLMTQEITVEPPTTTYNDDGTLNYGTAVTYTCRIQPVRGEEIIRSADYGERKASWKILVNATAAIDSESRLTLPSGYEPQQPPFFASAVVPDDSGGHHVVLMV